VINCASVTNSNTVKICATAVTAVYNAGQPIHWINL